jgi:hypothetical protein
MTELDEKWPVNLACDSDFHVNRRVLLHAAKLRHGTDGFTSPPKEGMLWIFSPEKSDGFGRFRICHLDIAVFVALVFHDPSITAEPCCIV